MQPSYDNCWHQWQRFVNEKEKEVVQWPQVQSPRRHMLEMWISQVPYKTCGVRTGPWTCLNLFWCCAYLLKSECPIYWKFIQYPACSGSTRLSHLRVYTDHPRILSTMKLWFSQLGDWDVLNSSWYFLVLFKRPCLEPQGCRIPLADFYHH